MTLLSGKWNADPVDRKQLNRSQARQDCRVWLFSCKKGKAPPLQAAQA
jgi:hypothetical protein